MAGSARSSRETLPVRGSDVHRYPHGRVPRPVRRRQILGEALTLFVERGYEGASMDELSRRAGVSKPVIYDLVGSKEQLFHVLMVGEADELTRRIAAAADAEPKNDRRFYAIALAFFRYVEERRAYWGALVRAEASPMTREIAALRQRHAVHAAHLMSQGAAQQKRKVDRQVIEACAHAVNGAFEALAGWWQEHPQVPARAMAEIASDLLVPGLVASNGRRAASPRRGREGARSSSPAR